MITIIEERFKTETGFGFGVFTVMKDREIVFQTKPKHKKFVNQFTTSKFEVKNKNQAKKIIESRGELRNNSRIKNSLFSLFG